MLGKHYFLFVFVFIFLLLLKEAEGQYKMEKHVFSQEKMGSPFTLTIYGRDSLQTAQVAELAFEKVDSLNVIFSDYLENSEINNLSNKSGNLEYVSVSSELFQVLTMAKTASSLSKGAFDVTIGPVVKLWRKARKENHFPESFQIEKALEKTGYQYIQLNKKEQSVRLKKAGMQLDFGGIAKGYIAQVVLNFLKMEGFSMAMVNAGGDIVVGDAPPHNHAGWKVGIALPEEKISYSTKMLYLKNQSVATSGGVYQYFEWEGKRYSHIINPKTGKGVTTLRNVTVVADNGATADWLASACSVLSVKKAFRLVEKFPDVALGITEKRGGKMYKKANKLFKQLLMEE